MLQSKQIERRQSEIRERLSALAGKDEPEETEVREMQDLDKEYRTNETRYRAALAAEDQERRQAADALETRDGSEWQDLIGRFELRQAALHLDEGRPFDGATAEVVQELRNAGGYRGVPIPYAALEQRAGETVASGTPDPVQTRGLIDRLFPQSVAGALGGRLVNVDAGEVEYPLTTAGATAAWAASETGNVGDPTAFETVDRPLRPAHNLGVQMKLTRRTLKQTAGVEQAVRRDLRRAIQVELDRAVFQGTGAAGQPLGIMAGAGTYGVTETAIDDAATWAVLRSAVTRFITRNAAGGPGGVRALVRPEVWDAMDDAIFDAGSGITEWGRASAALGGITLSHNALPAPAGSPAASSALLTTSAGGEAPFVVATWGAVDLIRDPFSDAQSGGLRLTGIVTADVTVLRSEQVEVLTGLQG